MLDPKNIFFFPSCWVAAEFKLVLSLVWCSGCLRALPQVSRICGSSQCKNNIWLKHMCSAHRTHVANKYPLAVYNHPVNEVSCGNILERVSIEKRHKLVTLIPHQTDVSRLWLHFLLCRNMFKAKLCLFNLKNHMGKHNLTTWSLMWTPYFWAKITFFFHILTATDSEKKCWSKNINLAMWQWRVTGSMWVYFLSQPVSHTSHNAHNFLSIFFESKSRHYNWLYHHQPIPINNFQTWRS